MFHIAAQTEKKVSERCEKNLRPVDVSGAREQALPLLAHSTVERLVTTQREDEREK
jgi:hypothetical protein